VKNLAKTDLTNNAERLLISRSIRDCKRFALEIPCSHNGKLGKVDFTTVSFDTDSLIPEITCYEIKVSESDFNSENGHNFYGDYNYYVFPKELYDKLRANERYSKLFEDVWYNRTGIIVFTDKQIKVIKSAKLQDRYDKFTFEERMRFIDKILISWTTGSMWKYMKRHGIELRNDAI
jgi:hypothetical protein